MRALCMMSNQEVNLTPLVDPVSWTPLVDPVSCVSFDLVSSLLRLTPLIV